MKEHYNLPFDDTFKILNILFSYEEEDIGRFLNLQISKINFEM